MHETAIDSINPYTSQKWSVIKHPSGCGVYFLYYLNDIVYIGSTGNIKRRISDHKRDKVFDSYSFFKISESKHKLREIEYELIYRYPTIYNRLDMGFFWFLNNKSNGDVVVAQNKIDEWMYKQNRKIEQQKEKVK